MPEPDELQQKLEAMRRAKILDAAARAFAERGFHAARVQDIAKAAGIAHGTVYNYFPNKEALLLGLLDRLNETEARPAQLARLSTEAPREVLRSTVKHRLQVLAENEELLRALLPELLVNPTLRERYLREVVGPSMELGEQALARLVPPEQAPAMVRMMASTVLGHVIFRLLGEAGSLESSDAIAELCAEAFSSLLDPQEQP
jgi:AcrR family transcriptional regulator